MTIKEFIEKKNEIIKNITGETLVPENQIINFGEEDTEEFRLHLEYYLENDLYFHNEDICPYCHKYQSCSECVMAKNNNECRDSDSTFKKVLSAVFDFNLTADFYDLPGMNELITEFIKGK